MTARITQFPGTTAAHNALSDAKTSPEVRTAAVDLLWAAHGENYHRLLTDEELATIYPRKADRFPPLEPPDDDNRGGEMLGCLFVGMAGCIVAGLILFGLELAGVI